MSNEDSIKVQPLVGEEISEHRERIFQLRIQVFREFPYLYDGDVDYERKYLANYIAHPQSVLVVAMDGEEIVGVSTGMPLADADVEFIRPIKRAGYDPQKVYYFAESVLTATYRGRGIGTRFFEEREAHVRRLGGFEWMAFAAVERAEDHPLRPRAYRSHESFWRRRGYVHHPELVARLTWKQIAASSNHESVDQVHTLSYWLKSVDEAEP